MQIAKLKLSQFRNYSQLILEFHPKFNIFIGKNGIGKTNLLESLYYLANLKSFRTHNLQHLVQKGKSYYQIKTQLIDSNAQKSIYQYNYQAGKKSLYQNNILLKKSHLLLLEKSFKTLLFANNDLLLALKPPLERRNYFDTILSNLNPNYKKILAQYQKVLQNRNRELKIHSPSFYKWDEQVAELGSLIINARNNFLAKIKAVFQNNFYRFQENQNFLPEIVYFSNFFFTSIAEVQNHLAQNTSSSKLAPTLTKEQYFTHLQKIQQKEKYKRTTLIGPHLDEFLFFLDHELLKEFASQGQMRIFIYALKSAILDYMQQVQKIQPIILLDDVFADLDQEKIKIFLNYFKNKGQFFLTCANANLIQHFLKELPNSQYKLFKF